MSIANVEQAQCNEVRRFSSDNLILSLSKQYEDIDDEWMNQLNLRGKAENELYARPDFHPLPFPTEDNALFQGVMWGVIEEKVQPGGINRSNLETCNWLAEKYSQHRSGWPDISVVTKENQLRLEWWDIESKRIESLEDEFMGEYTSRMNELDSKKDEIRARIVKLKPDTAKALLAKVRIVFDYEIECDADLQLLVADLEYLSAP